jgi:hypothetical protein
MEVPHPNYNSIRDPPQNDFMLLFLEGPSNAKNVITVKLNAYASVPSVGQGVTVMGWGDTDISKDFDPDKTYNTFFP